MIRRYIPLPWTALVEREVRSSIAQGLAYTITGAPGSGKTSLCRHLAATCRTDEQETHYVRCDAERDPAALFRDLVATFDSEPGKFPAIPDRRLMSARRVLSALLQKKRIRLLILDHFDKLDTLVQIVVFQFLDDLRNEGWDIGLVLAGNCPTQYWDDALKSAEHEAFNSSLLRNLVWTGGTSGTVRLIRGHYHIRALKAKEAAWLFHKWCRGTDAFGAPLKNNDAKALRLAEELASATSHNVALLQQFADRKNETFGEEELTIGLIRRIQSATPAATAFASLVAQHKKEQMQFTFT